VQPAAWIERRTVRGRENHAGSSDRHADRSWPHDTHADGSGCLIARSRNHWRSRRNPGRFRASGGNLSANGRRLVERRKHLPIDPGEAKHFRRPFACCNVEQQRARSVGDVDRAFSRQPVSDVILRQQKMARARPEGRFVLANPQQFRQCENSSAEDSM